MGALAPSSAGLASPDTQSSLLLGALPGHGCSVYGSRWRAYRIRTQDILVQMRRGEVLHELGDWLGGVWTLTWQTIVGGVLRVLIVIVVKDQGANGPLSQPSTTLTDYIDLSCPIQCEHLCSAPLDWSVGNGFFLLLPSRFDKAANMAHNSVCGLLPSFAN